MTHSYKSKVSSIFWRNCLSFRINWENSLLFDWWLFIIFIFFLINKFFPLPSYLLCLSSSILNEYLFHSCFISVNCSEIQSFEIIIAVYCWADSSGFKNNISIFSIFYNKVKNIIEFAWIISITYYIKFESFSRFKKSMLNFRFEYWYLLSGKCMELSFDFRIINNGNFLEIIFKNFNLFEIKLFRSNCHFRPIRVCPNV